MARLPRILLVAVMTVALAIAPATTAVAATPAEATGDAAAFAGARGVTSFISVVDRDSGSVLAQTGNANSQVASESIMKLMLAAYYLVLYGGQASKPDTVKARLSYMLRYSDDDTASSLFSANAIPTIAARYGMANTINATDRPGHWGAARITAADMTTFLFRASKDDAVGPWLIPVMAQTAPTGSGTDAGFSQYFGLNALSGDHGSKQGWGCDSFWTSPQCAIHSVGYTDTKFVAILQLGNGYPDPMRATATYGAQVISASTTRPNPIGAVDWVANPSPGKLSIAGWAADPDSPGQREQVHVYVTGSQGVVGIPGIFTDGSRPDVAAVFPWAGGTTGFGATVPTMGPGLNTVCAYAINVRPPYTNPSIGCRTIDVRNVFGRLDAVGPAAVGSLRVQGWAVNPNDPSGTVQVHVYDYGPSGTRAFAQLANSSRPDVTTAFPGYGPGHGVDVTVPATEVGQHTVCLYGINAGGGNNNPSLGCRDLTVANAFGAFDALWVSGSDLYVAGWALNPNNQSEQVEIHVYDYGPTSTRGYPGIRAGASRPDVGAAYPGFGSAHGYSTTVRTGDPGLHTVCVYAITTGGGVGNALLGCRQITVAG